MLYYLLLGDTTANLSKTAKRKLRKEQRKAELLIKSEKNDFIHFKKRKQDKEEGFERFRDEVKFGETVHEPPKLTALPKKAVSKEADVRVSTHFQSFYLMLLLHKLTRMHVCTLYGHPTDQIQIIMLNVL